MFSASRGLKPTSLRSLMSGLKPGPISAARATAVVNAEALGETSGVAAGEASVGVAAIGPAREATRRLLGRLARGMQMAMVCVALVVMLGAGGESQYERLGHGMMCICSCNQILVE